MQDAELKSMELSLPPAISAMDSGTVGVVLRVATSAAQALVNAIAAGDVTAVEQLSKVLPQGEQIEARAAALKARQNREAADTLPP